MSAGPMLARDGNRESRRRGALEKGTATGFMYIRTVPQSNAFTVPGAVILTHSVNCAGGGGTLAYNVSSVVGIAADLGGCKVFSNAYGAGNTIDGNIFTYLFGPRFT